MKLELYIRGHFMVEIELTPLIKEKNASCN